MTCTIIVIITIPTSHDNILITGTYKFFHMTCGAVIDRLMKMSIPGSNNYFYLVCSHGNIT